MQFLRTFFCLCAFLFISVSTVSILAQDKNPVLLVLNKNEANMAILDAATMKVLGKVPVGDSPHEVVISADGKRAYVANYGTQTPGSSLSIIDLTTRKELKRVDLGGFLRPHGIVEMDGNIYFTSESSRTVARYNPASDKIDWVMGTGQTATHMLVISNDKKRLFTANIASDTVTAINLGAPPAPQNITQIAVGKQPEAIDVSPDGKEVWVGLNAEGAIDIIDTVANKFKEKIKLGERPYRVEFTPDGKRVFATMPNTKEIVVLDAATRKEIKRMKLDGVPLGLVFSKDGKTAFVSVVQPDGVLKFDTEKFEVLGKAETGIAPDGLAIYGI
jgi:DNA-binding beta-propeller fold protein YncE